MADALVAVSHTYLKRADVMGLPDDRKVVAYLGSDRLWFDDEELPPLRDTTRPMKAVYLGTLGGSYDIETLVRAAALVPSVEVEVIGYGPFEEKLKVLNSKLGGQVKFTGALPHDEAMARTVQADIALNAIRRSALQSVTNKLSDYFCAGLPILSSQINEEVNKLLSQGGGRTYNAGDVEGLARLMMELADRPETLRDMARSNRAIARKLFLRSETYEGVVDLLNKVLRASEDRT
jgi:glycosyltransferase involved in cell wall biosynthesis